jgi:hypothetical protein
VPHKIQLKWPMRNGRVSTYRLGITWLAFCFTLALHVIDEALTGFLSVYNPTVVALRQRLGFWPMPTFEFREWLSGLTALIVLLTLLGPLLFKNSRWVRPLAYFFALVAGILNSLGHTIATILGHTVSSVRFPRPAPGFYSSPFLCLAAIFVLLELRRTRSMQRLNGLSGPHERNKTLI